MESPYKLPYLNLLLLISFGSVNAVLFTPALPNIADFFAITQDVAQSTITVFLLGYALGQLVYGPIANRFGRKPAVYCGVVIQVMASVVCAISGMTEQFWLLIVGRFFLALGSGVGLKVTYTMVNETMSPAQASQKIAYLMLAFAVMPAIGVAIGGFLNTYFGWISCFYACAIYGLIVAYLTSQLPETKKELDLHALNYQMIARGYRNEFLNVGIVAGGILMGLTACFIYIFAAEAPFIAIKLSGMSSESYGIANLVPPSGIVAGSFIAARLAKSLSQKTLMVLGIMISAIGSLGMLMAITSQMPIFYSLFLPMPFIYIGICFTMANASTVAMSCAVDKAYGSAVMNFFNVGAPTVMVFALKYMPNGLEELPLIFLMICVLMVLVYLTLAHASKRCLARCAT